MNIELEIKTARLQEMLASEGLGGVLLNAQHNFAWLTGGRSNGIDLSRENGAASLFVRADGKRYILANNIEMPRMLAEEVSAHHFEPVEFSWQDEKSSADFVINIANSIAMMSSAVATDISMHPQTRAIEGRIASCRYELTEAERTRYAILGKDAGTAVSTAITKLIPGETEIEIAAKLRRELASHSIASVVTLVAADGRISDFRHPVPTANPWEKLLLLVTCAKRDGLIASLSRIICIGEIPAELRRKTEAAAYVNAKLCEATQPDKQRSELYQVAAQAHEEKGFTPQINNHHQGGATGYRTRDWVAHPSSGETVQMHQAFAWNPSITGTKVEETGIVTGNGLEIITATEGFPQIETVLEGRAYYSPGILSI
ncbi:MAG: M24 family metallopeptidase [Saprospiraceae bacterium]|nr:M24 family metallopeptidase [Pyrinomonadaceae bacterium]